MFDLVPFRKRNDDPFRQLVRSLNDTFDFAPLAPLHGSLQTFRTDIREQADKYAIEAELPGFGKDDVEVEMKDNYLTIRAKRQHEEEQKDEQNRVIRRERRSGEFVRRFYVDNVDEAGITAKLSDGVLKLDLPKKANTEPARRRIDIQ
ncbi:Hsp20/alpha crystallin family protein [Paenibacillus cymbidii]|uniref:Hsp20/alpha crystallin family protein n=1 Tax=Paenibacillus cymbidii TaxID=1639034 RepID=UPI0010804FA1|nr:Hsp20/alpha crystallin family protein [Paenibacillus cymbidii]